MSIVVDVVPVVGVVPVVVVPLVPDVVVVVTVVVGVDCVCSDVSAGPHPMVVILKTPQITLRCIVVKYTLHSPF